MFSLTYPLTRTRKSTLARGTSVRVNFSCFVAPEPHAVYTPLSFRFLFVATCSSVCRCTHHCLTPPSSLCCPSLSFYLGEGGRGFWRIDDYVCCAGARHFELGST